VNLDKPDLAEASRFLTALDPNARDFTFQTFDDSPAKRGALARVLHGPLQKHAAELSRLSAAGAGVFVTINETDGQGRRTENITRVRALFVDLDGSPLEPCLRAQRPPHIVVESSPGRWHVYWRVTDLPLENFSGMQGRLIEHFHSDPSVHDLPRVMRLPGFLHKKVTPLMVRIKRATDAAPYRAANFRPKAPDAERRFAPPLAEVITHPGRHEALVSLARTLSARAVCYEAILACLRAVNEYQCRPPLPDNELPRMARWAAKQPAVAPLVEDEDTAVSPEVVEMSAEVIEMAMARLK
jgi:hypothetical protein